MRRHILTALAAVLVTFVQPAAAASLPVEVVTTAGSLTPLGSGQARWLGIKLYEASLWVGPDARPEGLAGGTVALAIRYARSISSERLVDTSIDEIRRLGVADDARLEKWRDLLSGALPSVDEGDTLVGVFDPRYGAQFWHDGRLTADIDDTDLARAFLGIWLDARTRDPSLRANLLGRERGAR